MHTTLLRLSTPGYVETLQVYRGLPRLTNMETAVQACSLVGRGKPR